MGQGETEVWGLAVSTCAYIPHAYARPIYFPFFPIIFKYKNSATYVWRETANHGSEGGRGKSLLSASGVQMWGEEAEIPGLTQEGCCSNNPKCSTKTTSP